MTIPERKLVNMRFLVQRVSHASVTVEGKETGRIGTGFFVLIGVEEDDNRAVADKMISKLLGLRIFEDAEGKSNLALADVGGELLLISQFTLCADARHGNRPSYIRAGRPDFANEMYEYIVDSCRKQGYKAETWIFGAEMKCDLLNDGPFTIWLDSRDICPKLHADQETLQK